MRKPSCLSLLCAATALTAVLPSGASADPTPTHTVSVAIESSGPAGGGSGSVSASSGPIQTCGEVGGVCSGAYPEGSTVTFHATPDSHSAVGDWTGCQRNPDVPGWCTLTVPSQDAQVSVSFDIAWRTLAVTINGSGEGSVACNDAPCDSSYLDGTPINLTATPAEHSRFVGWSGACSGTGDCLIDPIDSDTALTATFERITHSLTIDRIGSGLGSVSCDGGPCASAYGEGLLLTLTANPDHDSSFLGWSGACSGTASCTIAIDADTHLTASFGLLGPPSAVSPVLRNPARRRCKKGFKARRVHKVWRCVRVNGHRHRARYLVEAGR